MNIRPKTEQDRVIEILMKLSEEDREELMSLCGFYPKFYMANREDFLSPMKSYDPYWPTQGCEA